MGRGFPLKRDKLTELSMGSMDSLHPGVVGFNHWKFSKQGQPFVWDGTRNPALGGRLV